MALPLPNTPFPPRELEPWFDRALEHDAWYSGDTAQLSRIYSVATPKVFNYHGEKRTGGIMNTVGGMFNRLFWGRPVPARQTRTTLHVPVAADIATMKSDMLWAEPPTFVAKVETGTGLSDAPKNVTALVDRMFNSPAYHLALNESGELTSALGGTYWRSKWNVAQRDYVWAEPVDADSCIPEWSGGELVAVNFWTTYIRGDNVYRHFERHERGAIVHALYRSDSSENVGNMVPLTELTETAPLASIPDSIVDVFTVTIPTGITRLTVAYQPNVQKSREFRRAPGALGMLGRSDYAGQEGVLSAIDEAWSSYMRDIRAGRSRIFVPDDFLNTDGPGKGATFDDEQEVFSQLRTLGTRTEQKIETTQFEIRWAAHEAAILALTKTLLRGAGLGTRDYDEKGNELTATGELRRDKREETTRDKGKRYASRAQGHIASVNLELNGLIFPGSGGVPGITVELEFPDESQQDDEKEARIIGLLNAARAISLETKVRRANPDWTEKELGDEVTRLKQEAAAAKPLALGAGATDEDDPDMP